MIILFLFLFKLFGGLSCLLLEKENKPNHRMIGAISGTIDLV